MRIISGARRGKKLLAPEGWEVRPTSDRVKEALFDILGPSMEGKRFLDLFAGSGQVGLEALSRGAAEAVFVDAARASIRVAEKNIAATGLGDRARVIQADAADFLRRDRALYDVIFLDPPYRAGLLGPTLPLAAERLAPGGALVCERARDEALPQRVGGLAAVKTYPYGKTALTVYRPAEQEEDL